MGVPIGKVIGALISSVYENPMRRLIASTSPSDPIPNANISTTGYFINLFWIFGMASAAAKREYMSNPPHAGVASSQFIKIRVISISRLIHGI